MKKTFTLIAASLITFFVLADIASAQASATGVQQGFSTFAGLITAFNNTVVKALATLFISGAVVAFFFGVTQFIWGLRQGKEGAITNGKQFMIWGLVALFVMFSVYGIIKVAQSLVPGLDSATITIPSVNYGGSGSQGTPVPNANTGNNPFTPQPNANTGTNPLTPTPNANTGVSGNNPSAFQASPNANTGTSGNNPSAFIGGQGSASSNANTGQTEKPSSSYGAECSDTVNSSDCSKGLVCSPTQFICVSPEDLR
jgi:succinate dehydrogenase/fumarate reductase cytochrome b subunit